MQSTACVRVSLGARCQQAVPAPCSPVSWVLRRRSPREGDLSSLATWQPCAVLALLCLFQTASALCGLCAEMQFLRSGHFCNKTFLFFFLNVFPSFVSSRISVRFPAFVLLSNSLDLELESHVNSRLSVAAVVLSSARASCTLRSEQKAALPALQSGVCCPGQKLPCADEEQAVHECGRLVKMAVLCC